MVTTKYDNQKHLVLNEPLAIIGMNCQFPGITVDIEDVDALHTMLMSGKTPIKEVPHNRWDVDVYHNTDRKKADTIISRKGGFLTDPSLFDNEFFKISPAEAKQMDPQHRLFLEVAVRALNHANITLASLDGSNTGVYCGISTHEYSQLNYKDNIEFNAYTPIGAANSAAVGRLSHFLNLKGPSLAVDTACSSSLTALYLGAMALRTQRCNLAIIGGVHLSLTPEGFIGFTKANMLSPRGECSSFDSKADGFSLSEGCAVVILKRLSDAIKDKDTIHAVIKSIVMNQDGKTTSISAPNVDAQIAMHQAALAEAGVKACDIDYLEAHGSGTPLGDSIEFQAIQTVHEHQHTAEKPLIIGALKSTLGHTISASGLASLIKVVGALQHDVIPPNLHYDTPHPSINPDCIPARFPMKPTPFVKEPHKKRTAQLANFGFSGINVCAILEEPPKRQAKTPSDSNEKTVQCFVLAAHSEYALKQQLANYLNYLQHTTASLQRICYTLQNYRDHSKFRCAILVADKATLIQKIASKDYSIKKVSLKKASTVYSQDALTLADAYLSGATIDSKTDEKPLEKADLPLYHFDRKPFWHESRQPTHASEPFVSEPIAIIGMNCRFPKANTLDAFLALLNNGECGMVDIPLDRWNNQAYYDANPDTPGKLYNQQLGLIDNIKEFDAEFFNISPRESKFMAPHLRVLLETTYHALEHANLSLDAIKGSSTGVFIGCEANEYPALLKKKGLTIKDLNIYVATGNALSAFPGRIAYFFDLKGPVQSIDTACSSSMTAIHNACLALQAGDCTMAIAGGVNLLLTPEPNITLSKAKMLSPNNRCKTFSADADGYARSEGCGVIILKRLSKALEDRDTILAVIKGSAVNSDGKSAGFTVPSGTAQEAVIRNALAKARLSPEDIDYIETHGTGTPVADPIEVNSLSNIFSTHHSPEKPLYISSVKTNLGHCESASGVASVIKAVFSLQNQRIFKHLHFSQLNPAITLKNTCIPLENIPWKKANGLRAAGINSFGFSGANAHLVLQESPRRPITTRKLPQQSVLVLSAKNETSLRLLLAKYQQYLATTDCAFADICYTAATCRSHFAYRVAITAKDATDAATLIASNTLPIWHTKKTTQALLIPNPEGLCPDPSDSSHHLNLATAYQKGFSIHWVAFYQGLAIPFEKVNLPMYEFVRQTYWFEDRNAPNNNRLSNTDFESFEQDAMNTNQPIANTLLSPWLTNYLELPPEQQIHACKNLLRGLCQKIQELPDTASLDEDEGFFDIGFDSLMLTEMAFELQEILEPTLKVTVHIAFDYPSINKLAAYITTELANKLIKKLQTSPATPDDNDSIAIIGMSCSLPNAPDIAAFESLLSQGLSGMKAIPLARWDNSIYYDPNKDAPNKSYVNQLGLIDHIKSFDAHFFGISPREAESLDPQQRLFLECSYHALESANYTASALQGCGTGVFAGVSTNEFYALLEKDGFAQEDFSLYSITGNVLNLVSGRVAYTFDFQGPSISVDTACSSSLVAIHYACQSLKNREIDYALAGGVNVLLLPESNITLSKVHALAADGKCKTFDASADGYARAEGCGVLLLKRLPDAKRDNDTILAVIKASAVNNDGKSVGLTAPNGQSQEAVMHKTLQQARLASHDISYIEAHGTGTPLGDSVEVHAINQVYGHSRNSDNPLYISSVKTNIGHSESASGVAGVIKTVLSLQNNTIYKHLHFKTLNPAIHLKASRIPLTNTAWNRTQKPRRAAVNTFGFSGTNAHVILEEYADTPPPPRSHALKPHLLVLSAKSKTALEQFIIRYQHYLTTTQHDFANICFTATTCRQHYTYRLALIAQDSLTASQCLEKGQFILSYHNTPPTAQSDDLMLDELRHNYLRGDTIDWISYYQSTGETFHKVALPHYPFDRHEFWPNTKQSIGRIKNYLANTTNPTDLPINKLHQKTKAECITTLTQILTEITTQVLALEDTKPLTATTNLFSLGMNSLMTLEIRHRIHDRLQCAQLSLSIEYFIQNPTIDNIARAITEELHRLFATLQHTPVSDDTPLESAALCDFQYLFWALNYAGYSYNVGMQLHLQGDLNKKYVAQAFDAVIQQNKAFWLQFDEKAPLQKVHQYAPCVLIYEDMPAQGESLKPPVLTHEFQNNLMRVIPLTQSPLIRVYLYKINNKLHEMHLIIPHIIVDDASCALVFQQFKENYTALTQGKKPIQQPEKDSFLDYVQHNNTHYEKNLPDKMRFWKTYNRGFKRMYFGENHHLPDATAYQTNYLLHYPLAAALIEPLITWHKSQNKNISSGLIAACQMAFHAISRQTKIPIILIHSGREGSQYKSVVGLFAEYKRINLTLAPNDTFLDCLESVDMALLHTAPYQKCSLFVKDTGIAGAQLSPREYAWYMLNKWFLTKPFKQSKLGSIVIDHYLKFLSCVSVDKKITALKIKIAQLTRRAISLQPPHPLQVVISITPSFFIDTPPEHHFANLNYSFVSHFGCLDRPVGNQTLWIYFTRDQHGDYYLSINGPITTDCKNQIAREVNDVITQLLKQQV